MAAGSTQESLRKVLGAIKDTTTVGLAQINSEFKVRSNKYYSSLSPSLSLSSFDPSW
jgi:hypothetical protein